MPVSNPLHLNQSAPYWKNLSVCCCTDKPSNQQTPRCPHAQIHRNTLVHTHTQSSESVKGVTLSCGHEVSGTFLSLREDDKIRIHLSLFLSHTYSHSLTLPLSLRLSINAVITVEDDLWYFILKELLAIAYYTKALFIQD